MFIEASRAAEHGEERTSFSTLIGSMFIEAYDQASQLAALADCFSTLIGSMFIEALDYGREKG